jgi:hypothetical protein
MNKPRQRDLDTAVIRAAPQVCDEILRRMRTEVPLLDDYATGFMLGHRAGWDRAIDLVERYKKECS